MTNRRDFIKSAGAMLGTACLFNRAGAADKNLCISPVRGGDARTVLSLTPLELRVGAAKPFKALHVSDTHLNFWDVIDFCGSRELNDCFERRWVRFPQALNSFYATLDHAERKQIPVLHTGDLIDWNSRGNRRVLRRNINGVDFFYSIGNHEYHASPADGAPEMTHDEARAELEKILPNNLTVASRVINGVNFVAFDDAETNLREETVRGVKAEFEKGLPIVLMCHIPPYYPQEFLKNGFASKQATLRGQGVAEENLPTELPKPVQDFHDGRTRGFYDWLRGQKALKAILCGHTHVEERGPFSETADMIVAGGNFEGLGYEITFT